MADFQGTLLFDSAINLQGLTQSAQKAKAVLDRLGTDAAKTFQNDIGRALGNAVRPENFAADVAKSKALLKSIGIETSKTFETTLGRKQAKALLQPFVDETTTLKGRFKEALNETFSLKNIAGGILSTGAIIGVINGLSNIGKEVIAIGRDAVETRDKFNLVFGEMSEKVRNNSIVIADSVGRARVDLEDFFASFGTFLTGLGFERPQIIKLSEELTKLAIDVASLNNKQDADVIRDFQSALAGQTETVRKYGSVILEERVKQEAFNLGLVKAGQSLTEQQKVFVRYQLLVKDLALAQNNAINTSDSLANQQKRLSANFTNFADQLSTLFIPSLAQATSEINTLLEALNQKDLSKGIKGLGELLNIKFNAADIGFGLGGVLGLGDKAKEITAEIKQQKDIVLDAVTVEAKRPQIYEMATDALKDMIKLHRGDVDAAREELKKREDIARAAKQTADELERLNRIKLPDYLTQSKQAFEFGKIRGVDNKAFSNAQFKKDLEILLNIKLTPLLKIDAKKISGLEKVSDDLRGALSDVAFPIQAFLIDLDRLGIATQSELVGLADLFDRGLGDVFDSLFNFVDKATDPNGTILGQFLAGSNFFITAFTQAKSLVDSAFKALFGESDLQQRVQERVDAANAAREAEERQSRDFIQALKDVEEALKGPEKTAGELIDRLNGLTVDITEISGLTGKQIQTIFDALKGQNFKPATTLQEFIDQLTFLSYQKPELAPIIQILQSIKDPNLKQVLITLFGQLPGVLDAISNFGNNIGQQFDALVKNLNTRFDLLNIDDPLKKLDLLAKGIRDKFKAIVPTTDAGIRDLIAKGLEALEAGGQTLVNFLKGLDLEELTADQFRDFLQLLNQLANEAKSKVEDIGKATDEEITIAAVRQITYTQGNKLIDELTTMRIIQTQMLDIMRGASLRTPNFRNFGIPGNRIVVVNNTGVTEGSEADLRGLNRRQLELAMAASRAQGVN